MHDLKALRDNPAHFDANWARRGLDAQTPALLDIDNQLRAAMTRRMEAEAQRNAASKAIGIAKAQKNDAEANRLMAEVADAKAMIEQAGQAEAAAQAALDRIIHALPNLPDAAVPDGEDETGNVTIKTWGALPQFSFQPKDHVALGEALGGMDFEGAARMSGARFVVLRGQLARLERALGQFMLDQHTGQNGYVETNAPVLVRDHALFGTSNLPKFEEDLFKTTDGRYLIPTSEVSLTNLVREQILDDEHLPIRMTALSPCFRSEAGSAGRDTRGMIRQHQFWKVELVSITTPETSDAEHERMTTCAEGILEALKLPYRRMLLCAGDMGFAARRTYDLEVWLPGQNDGAGAYREISSCSNCGDFQARRMDARTRPKGEKATRFVHTLNGSGLAVGRTLVAVLENYQQEDGTIKVPDVLIPYMGGLTHIG
ncbi:serine-tRNA ligase [Candidatus Phycosocius bacilliformis]|uniref:Serine--tRNA ligase n=1 Tax=Candidatus Phycosocius bacilliformis TaxID=1445552 RepID=A0A2P2E970_9PROT|nr:serine--tRNA ligase [Candidatus Phycosocius bacilliformis]GBF57609.1 serine-tRNA ligase [Candidatus Phycosocius bacilliformis]